MQEYLERFLRYVAVANIGSRSNAGNVNRRH